MTHDNATSDQVVLDGIPFSYEITGKGHPLALVHAGIADQRMWDDQVAVFAQYYQVLRYDLRGYGKTPLSASPFSHHNDLYNLLTSLGIERAYLVGCSMGGTTILDFALEHPEMVDALMLVASAPSGYEFNDEMVNPDDEASKLQQEHEAAIQHGDLAKASEIEARYWLVGLQRSADHIDPTLLTRLSEMNKIALTNTIANPESEQALEPPAITRLSEIHIPTLVIVGNVDDPNIVKSSELLATHISDAQKAVIANTAHFPNMERPTEFNHLILRFLAGLTHST